MVTSVKSEGPIVFATEFLGSITAMRVVANEAGAGLVPVASDRWELMCSDGNQHP